MAKPKEIALSVLVVLLTYYVQPVPADYCYDESTGNQWTCSYKCCYQYDNCCRHVDYGAAYWYAWFLIALIFLLCVCTCVGCGGYRYRRRYYTTTIVTQPEAPTTVYQAQPAGYQAPRAGYQSIPTAGYDAPPPYNPTKPK